MSRRRTGEDEERAAQSRRILERVEQENASLGGGWLSSRVSRARNHFTGADKAGDDPIEVWGTRIGRIVGFVIFLGLVVIFIRALAQP